MKKTIQEVMSEMNEKLAEAIRAYQEGMVCPKESLNYIIHVVCTANEEAEAASCDQVWKACLLETKMVCSCKTKALPTDIVGRCQTCKKDIPATDIDNVIDHGIEVTHKICP